MYHTVPLNAKSQDMVPSFFDFLWFFIKRCGNPPPTHHKLLLPNGFQ